MAEGGYCRVYFSILDDPKFDGVREDERHLATWLRLLMIAELSWPATPELPGSALPESLAMLRKRKIIDLLPGRRFRVRGLRAERERRSAAARTAANARWHPNGTGNAGA